MSSINLENIKDALYTWVNTETGDETIFARENAPQPSLTAAVNSVPRFFIINIASLIQIGQDYTDPELDVDGKIEISGNREFTISIECKGGLALDRLEDLRSSLEKPSVQQTLRDANIATVDHTPISDLTSLDDTVYIERGILEIIMRTSSFITDDVGYFNNTGIDGEYKNIDGTVAINDSFEVIQT